MTEAKTKHPLYRRWVSMRQRCNDPNAINYHRYGGKGIRVCDRWDDFWLFVEDMGECPAGFTLNRIDSSKDYCPDNCEWATPLKQTKTRSFYLRTGACSGTPYLSRHSNGIGWNLQIAIRKGERFSRYFNTYEQAEQERDVSIYERDFYRYVGIA